MHISLASEKLFEILGFPVTNTILMTWLVMGVLLIFGLLASYKLRLIPRGIQNISEAIIDFILDFIEPIVGSKEDAKKFFPIVTSFFILIALSNWLEVLPGLGSIGIFEGHGEERMLLSFVRSPSSDLNFTLALAIVSVFVIQITGIAAVGFFKYVSKFISFKSPVNFFVGFLEIISEIAKIISFSFRLFGNIFAGEVLLLVVGVLIPFIVPLPFLLLELFVGLIQALVFSMLTLVFLKVATTEIEH